MVITPASLDGAALVQTAKLEDARGPGRDQGEVAAAVALAPDAVPSAQVHGCRGRGQFIQQPAIARDLRETGNECACLFVVQHARSDDDLREVVIHVFQRTLNEVALQVIGTGRPV